jgi:hypothetical protein
MMNWAWRRSIIIVSKKIKNCIIRFLRISNLLIKRKKKMKY